MYVVQNIQMRSVHSYVEDHDIKSIKKFIKEVDLDELKEACENKTLSLDKTEKYSKQMLNVLNAYNINTEFSTNI